MSRTADQLWEVAVGPPHVDAGALARAVEEAVSGDPLDYRTRLLVRDSVRALRSAWGEQRVRQWLDASPAGDRIEHVCRSSADAQDTAFPSLPDRIVNASKPPDVLQFLRELSAHVAQPTRLVIGGSIALMLANRLVRHTEDIDVVDEVPAELRARHGSLTTRYGLQLTHFQSHDLPARWDTRLRSIGTFGKLHVFAVDEYDVLLGKLFSAREKDLDDLRGVGPPIDRAVLEQRLREAGKPLMADQRSLEAARRNWFILFGGALPG